jgi:signal peptidase I
MSFQICTQKGGAFLDIKPFENSDGSSGFDYERFIIEEEASSAEDKPARKKRSSEKKEEPAEIYEWMQSLVSALLICVIVFAFFVRIIGIIGSSMEPTFSDGDSVVISNILYTPEQGDIIVLRKLSFQEEPIIKRVIAVAGQTVDIDFEAGIVYVDDQPLDEPYTAELTYTPINFDGKITVPENCIFVMGDNRNHSTDSRSNQVGFVDVRYVMGKVLLRLLPIDEFGLAQ